MTPEQRAILADVVVDPDVWAAHARVYAAERWDRDKAHLDRLVSEAAVAGDDPLAPQLSAKAVALRQRVDAGPDLYYLEFLTAKVERHRADAETMRARPGYKNRAQREEAAAAERAAREAGQAQKRAEAEEQRKAAFDAAVASQVNVALAARGIPAPAGAERGG